MDVPIDGLRVGHWTDEVARTGVTVLLFPEGTVASGEVRGGAPATREFEVLEPTRTVDRLDALVLSGGSAFGLAAADGVVDHLADSGVGFPTGAGPVPIVVGLSLFDLLEGDDPACPGASEGRAAAEAATMTSSGATVPVGRVGVGTGATVGKWRGRRHARPGGFGVAVARHAHLTVAALVAVNAAGDVGDPATAEAVADGTFAGWPEDLELFGTSEGGGRGNTTIGAVVTDAALSKVDCRLLATSAHDGLARAVFPAHARSDGDAFAAAATGKVPLAGEGDLDVLRVLATAAVQRAIVRAC
ncbi:MAG: P1 family peptidase [Actinomycetota bacterium]|nr:P1 family peptidase [Actinomycetota bacterium]